MTKNPTEERDFIKWMRETKKIYVGDEYHFRFEVWLANYKFVHSRNAISTHFTCRMTSLAALTPSEYQSYISSTKEAKLTKSHTPKSKSHNKKSRLQKPSNSVFPANIDLRTKIPGILNPIQDVGSCSGGDWAFSVTTSIEANHCLKRGNLYKLSEQCLIDCVDVCSGCDGGNSFDAFEFLAHSKVYQLHINKEADYPWTASKSECKFDLDKALNLVRGYTSTGEDVEEEMVGNVYSTGIGCIRMDASLSSFKLYSGGIYDDKECGTKTNHEVNVVGYGVEGDDTSDLKYWICRNCWGTAWGEEGYFRILRDANQCGLAKMAVFPILF